MWGNLSVTALDRKLSDHFPIVLKDMDLDFGPKPFCVFNILLEEADFYHVVETDWKQRMRSYRPDFIFRDKLKNVKDTEGDENSKFFHSFVKKRNNKCNLRGPMVSGVWSEDPKSIKAEMARHYKKLFSKGEVTRPIFCSKRIEKISMKDARSLEKGFDAKEVVDPIGLGDFRPISLIGCYYKIITKMLAGRVKRVVGIVVGKAQNAFIRGRFILDGVLIANETMVYLRNKKKKSSVFKVDFEKVYDSLNWRFLRDIIKKMGFEDKWCKWVDYCLSSSSISILVNGSSSEEFRLEKGVRQGDPLSPFLFILAAEGLNAIVNKSVEKGIFRGVTVGENNVTLSHFQYTDDTIFFREWSKENAKSLMCILKWFEEVSGLRVNYNKGKIYGIGVSKGEMADVTTWMGCDIEEFSFTYLGKWWWRFRKEGDNLWVKVVKSMHGPCGSLGDVRDMGGGVGGGVWGDIVIGEEIDGLGDWVRVIRGRVNKEYGELLGVLQHVVVSNNCRDRWRWSLDEDEEFTVKKLSRLIELRFDIGDQGTLWNKLVPKKVSIFICRVLRGRLSIRVELDKRGIDLDSFLCQSCNNVIESCVHCLITCDLAMSVWDKIFKWWKVRIVNAFTIDEFFSSNGNVNVPIFFSRVWQAVLWTTGYFIWKERNTHVFNNKVSSTNKIVQDIQLKSFE
nr:reverse transcriptase domain, reverse transcriptase zinc-binding domain protein [Tanacetum cinerariifolium]